jgi:hypothetical protein
MTNKTSRNVTIPATFSPVPDDIKRRVTNDSTHVKVEVFYSKGESFGNKRGFYGVALPVERKDNVEAFTLFDPRAVKVFLAPADRFNAKVLDTIAAKVLPTAPDVAAAVASNDRAKAALIFSESAAFFTKVDA